ncbi:class I SAM-dependent methyltransferase [Jiella marina]|uniref:class I SAM-dependent methyltransferase n=1 Tax=Jiella sp. LLJ827 TaxID=2917712 RepID=UPI0021006B62|nr:class I SAM-dependent methyltransferase [Jiella sp. LLJ827]MCQ0986805.1 class I SAM-dependent methyltransferase [Jiella sp. LLJ827]
MVVPAELVLARVTNPSGSLGMSAGLVEVRATCQVRSNNNAPPSRHLVHQLSDIAMQTPAALNAAFASGNAHAVLAESLSVAGAKRVLDIGCGAGALAGALAAKGFSVTGIDPNETAVANARKALPELSFEVSGAESLPFEDDGFDAAVFLNSLHHVPMDAMARALREARRVVKPEGTVLIVEPLAEGSQFEVMRPVEDETEVREAAARAIADAVREETFRLRGNVVFEEKREYPSARSVIDHLIAVDPRRSEKAERMAEEVERLFALHAETHGETRRLTQPLRIYWLG